MTGDGSHPLIEQCLHICAQLGVTEFIVAPGSRSAPITVALSRHPAMRCRVVYDERSAGYMALGMAQQLGRAVGLVCTSGTAALNFAPAVVEAFYQRIPLLVLTADRPPEWIDQQDNQAIHQNGLYAPHVAASYTLPLDDGRADTAWFARRIVAEAIQQTMHPAARPVHINVPLPEPLYPPPDRQMDVSARKFPRHAAATWQLAEDEWQRLQREWNTAQRKLVIAGQHPPHAGLAGALRKLGSAPDVAVIGDITANIFPAASDLAHWETVLSSRDHALLDSLRPELVIVYGGQVTSRALKSFLRASPPSQLWHVAPTLPAPDSFQALTTAIPMRPEDFFARLANTAAGPQSDYAAAWRRAELEARRCLEEFLRDAPFGEFMATWQVLNALPAGSHLQLGNSMPIRYANIIGCRPEHEPGGVFANRGTSGIDGALSTAVGAALASGTLTTLLVGDLGFFYDRNGLWHDHLPANLRIVVLNNHGGGIFGIIEGPNRLTDQERETFFLTPQPLTARRSAEDHGLRYFHAASEGEVAEQLPAFFAPHGRAALLEIETEMGVNSAVFGRFREMMGRIAPQEHVQRELRT